MCFILFLGSNRQLNNCFLEDSGGNHKGLCWCDLMQAKLLTGLTLLAGLAVRSYLFLLNGSWH